VFNVGRTHLAITKPDGSMLRREVILYADPGIKTIGVKFVGDSPLKGYAFDLMDSEIERVRASGVPMSALPDTL
jgi:hypothetical protein